MKSLITFILLMLLFTGCSGSPEDSAIADVPEHLRDLENLTVYEPGVEPAMNIELIREVSFESSANVIIGHIQHFEVDDAGRIYIADGQEEDIKVFNPEGFLMARLGREGEGPGEFRQISTLQITHDKLFAFDSNLKRTVVFSLDSLHHENTINLAVNRNRFSGLQETILNGFYAFSDSTFLTRFSKSNISENSDSWDSIEISSLYYLLNKEGEIMSKQLFELISSTEILVPLGNLIVGRPFPFNSKLLLDISDDNRIYWAWSEEVLFHVFNLDGSYQRAFYYPLERQPLTMDDAFAGSSPEFRQLVNQNIEVPENWPSLNSMLIDDKDRLWFSTIVEGDAVYEWWVLEDTGELISKFTWPRDQPIQVVKNGYAFARETNEMSVQSIVRYRIEMEASD